MSNEKCRHELATTPAIENRVYSLFGDEKENTKHFIMWSGGADSTLLLYELLDAYGSDRVVAISYTYPWLTDIKKDSEKKQRDAFKAKMNLRGDRYSQFCHMTFDVSNKYEGFNSSKFVSIQSGGLPQSIAWLFSIPLYVPDMSYVYTGAIRTDDLTYYKNEYGEIIRNISKILQRDFIYREPYIQLQKHDVLEKLFLYSIYDVTWFCELPDQSHQPCLECTPCKDHLLALHYLSQRSSYDEIKVCAQDAYDRLVKNNEIK